jgi:hypothetical protein
LREPVPTFVDGHDFAVGLVLRVLGIPSSTYYRWRARLATPSRRQVEDAELLEVILKIRSGSEFAATYGSPRVRPCYGRSPGFPAQVESSRYRHWRFSFDGPGSAGSAR